MVCADSRKAGSREANAGARERARCGGSLAFYQGDYPGARARYEESLGIQREVGDLKGVAIALSNLGGVALDQGDFASAQGLQEDSLAIARELGHRSGIANSLGSLGNVALYESDYQAAWALYEECLVIRRELGERWGIAQSLKGLAAARDALGTSLSAARIWGVAERLQEEIGSPSPPIERARDNRRIAGARAALGDDAAFDRAWQEGRGLNLEQAIELAFGKTTRSPSAPP